MSRTKFFRKVVTLNVIIILSFAFVEVGLTQQRIFQKDKQGLRARIHVPDEIIVKYKPGMPSFMMSQKDRKLGMSVIDENDRIGFRRLRFKKGSIDAMVQKFRADPAIEYAEPNYIAHAHFTPNDPLYSYQWHLDNTGGSAAILNLERFWGVDAKSI